MIFFSFFITFYSLSLISLFIVYLLFVAILKGLKIKEFIFIIRQEKNGKEKIKIGGGFASSTIELLFKLNYIPLSLTARLYPLPLQTRI